MNLKKLPSIIRDTKFSADGLAISENGLLVPAYVASQFGFNSPGREFLESFYERLRRKADILPLCPFKACGEYLDKTLPNWREFNRIVGLVNYEILIPKSKLLIALLDGSHAIDDGVSAEIGFYAGRYPEKPIIGIRSDFRRASENPETAINLAVKYLLEQNDEGRLFAGSEAYDDAITYLSGLTKKIIEKSISHFKSLNKFKLE